MAKISKRFNKIAEIYRFFAREFEHVADFSEQAKINMFHAETYGQQTVDWSNGYFISKK